jgi:DNA-binding NarL/FixJ family response regulator
MTIAVVIADDQQLVRAGLRMIISDEDDIEVVGEAATGNEAVSLARALQPDVVLMDIRMPDIDGIGATRQLLAQAGTKVPRVFILTTFDLDEYVYDALQAGASGFLLKDAPAHQLVGAIRMVRDGDALLAPSVTRRLIEQFTNSKLRTSDLAGSAGLTPREAEVFQLIGRGMSNVEIARKLFLGENTVKTHVARVLTKLGARDRVQVVVLAYEAGVVKPGDGG